MQYQTIIQTTIDGFWINDTQGRLHDVNNALCMMLGFQRKELLKMRISDFEAKETPDEIISRVQNIIKQGHDRFESQHRCKDGTIIDVELNIQYMDYKDGMFIVFVRDVSEQKRLENELVVQEQIMTQNMEELFKEFEKVEEENDRLKELEEEITDNFDSEQDILYRDWLDSI